VAKRLAGLGVTVVPHYGVGGYRVDFAAAHPAEPGRMVLAIEADGASYRDSRSARDRDRLRKEHLERLGWTFHRIWSTNWLSDPDSEAAKVEDAYRRAVGKTGVPRSPEPAEQPFAAGNPEPPGHADAPGSPEPPEQADAPGSRERPGRAVAVREPAIPERLPGSG
jgi:very-short-patch-repair endonuclease